MSDFDWVQPTLERISDLLKLPAVHNCYGTPKVDPGCAWRAIGHLHRAGGVIFMPTPRVTPTMNGGLVFEWHGLLTECRMTVDLNGTTVFLKVGLTEKESAIAYGGEAFLQEAFQRIQDERVAELAPVSIPPAA